MKRLFIIFLIILIIIISFLLFDLHVYRGYYYSEIFNSPLYHIYPDKAPNLTYSIKHNIDSSWTFKIKNNELSYNYFVHYRNGERDVTIVDSILIIGLSNIILYDKNPPDTPDLFFWCGTGLGRYFLRPYEEFLWNTNDPYPLFADMIFLSNDRDSLKNCVRNDSLDLALYITMFSIGSSKFTPIISNRFKISYSRLEGYYDAWKNKRGW